MSALGNAPLLDIKDLRLGYGRNDVIDGISITVPKGAIVSLIGANGAGKTTILRGLSGLIKPRAGSILFKGQELAGRSAHRIARTGLVHVPEGRQVFAEMTVAENLAMGAYRIGAPSETIREKILARFPRLRERLGQRAGLMSGGEQQMLAIGRALMSDPEILLLDEPSMGLAPLVVDEIFAAITEFRAEGRTVLLVEQNAGAALDIADYAYVLESGRVDLHGPGHDIAKNPAVISAYLGF
jgi:branched-chain amino acid transport system ATP-binding protein